MECNPSFDSLTKSWFVDLQDGRQAEATTLRQLKAGLAEQLGSDIIFPGYCPEGADVNEVAALRGPRVVKAPTIQDLRPKVPLRGRNYKDHPITPQEREARMVSREPGGQHRPTPSPLVQTPRVDPGRLTTAHIEEILNLHAQTKPRLALTRIAKVTNISLSAVKYHLRAARGRNDPRATRERLIPYVRPQGRFDAWAPHFVTKLRHLIDEGLTGEAIAYELGNGFTRSAVLGKAHRLGLSIRGQFRKQHLTPRNTNWSIDRTLSRRNHG